MGPYRGLTSRGEVLLPEQQVVPVVQLLPGPLWIDALGQDEQGEVDHQRGEGVHPRAPTGAWALVVAVARLAGRCSAGECGDPGAVEVHQTQLSGPVDQHVAVL